MECVEPLGPVIYSTPPRRPLWQWRSRRRQAMVLEDIRGIRALHRKGNGQGRKYRGRMNAWSFSEAQRQIEYKARWTGLSVIRLSRRETRGSSMTCPRCGEKL
ncbi:IS200/IS605 family element transposase accessory protein TnpB [Candidatus Bathyarchaeota archaeon]|nr:MAG: IS200/IS605 family element transposase accessory protein TnpB [Candidatus Bathyarchaeota archaeon]TMI31526.1 MAG: IS200/IS605 family element transposase accessory protein TnpB [Candidatus Bathyarchaeota archaeon]